MSSKVENDSVPITEREGTKPEVFFDSVHKVFQKAAETVGGSIQRRYCINDHVFEVHFAGSSLIPCITPALETLETDTNERPSLTIYSWDNVSTQTSLPPPPWTGYHLQNPRQDTRSMYTPRGDIRGYGSARVHVAFHMGADVLTMLDTKRNIGLYWTEDATLLPSYEARSPLRSILHWWLRRAGCQLVHAGAVGTVSGGVMLAGKSGSGKSTAALTCLNSDLLYVSDDYCLISSDPAPQVHNLYGAAKINSDNIHRVPHLTPAFRNRDPNEIEKTTFFVNRHFPQKMVSGFPVKALFLPRVTGHVNTTLSSAQPQEGLSALALSTMAQLAGADGLTLQRIKKFVDQIPCYHLDLGTDLTQIPEVVLNFLNSNQSEIKARF